MSSLTTAAFRRLVSSLKQTQKTLCVVEQSCGGLIQTSIMAQPGASKVFLGGTIPYNTRQSKPILLNSEELHQRLLSNPAGSPSLATTTVSECSKNADSLSDETKEYMQSKLHWTAETSVAFCRELGTDYCIAEGGATGPTFRPQGLTHGFTVVTIAGRVVGNGTEDGTDGGDSSDSNVQVLHQELIESNDNRREENMRKFADKAAELLTAVNNNTTVEDQIDPTITDAKAEVTLDRATHLRSNTEALECMEHRAKYVILSGSDILVSSQDSSQLSLLSHPEVSDPSMELTATNSTKTFLGILNDASQTPVFGYDLCTDPATPTILTESNSYQFVDTRTSAPLFSTLHNALALHASAYAQWQRRSRHCPQCGAPQSLTDHGTKLVCTACQTPSWPRQDPSMIAVISSRCRQKLLLARSPRHAERLHTTLAGFVEAGETFEDAVRRETYEEVGIRIDADSVRYIGSQPWPFPQSTMIGFQATADDEVELTIDETEIVSARWFSRDEVERAARVEGPTMQKAVAEKVVKDDPSIPLLIPPKGVIARKLIDQWLSE